MKRAWLAVLLIGCTAANPDYGEAVTVAPAVLIGDTDGGVVAPGDMARSCGHVAAAGEASEPCCPGDTCADPGTGFVRGVCLAFGGVKTCAICGVVGLPHINTACDRAMCDDLGCHAIEGSAYCADGYSLRIGDMGDGCYPTP